MEKNLRCPDCKSNAYHLHRNDDGTYALKYMSGGCERKIGPDETALNDLTK